MSGGDGGRHFDALETRDPARRDADLMAALARQVAHAKAASKSKAPCSSAMRA